jgi:hypothetical protein
MKAKPIIDLDIIIAKEDNSVLKRIIVVLERIVEIFVIYFLLLQILF